jgi:peptidoglycan/LPS O-acetylase OafA/YrhL
MSAMDVVSRACGPQEPGAAETTVPQGPGRSRRAGDRIPSLDRLRGVAVLLVLGRHLQYVPELPQPLPWLMGYWNRCGWVGVDLFFVLSGFLVAGLVFEEWKRTGSFAAGRFLIRRGFKIYPAFYLLWSLVFLGQWLSGRGFDPARLMHEFLFIQNYGPAEWHHTWSLAVEEHFYFGLALLCRLRVRFHRGPGNPFIPLVWVGVALLVLCPLGRWYTAATGPFGYGRNVFPTHLRLDSLMFGVLLSWWWSFRREGLERWVRAHRRLCLLVGVVLLLPTLFFSVEDDRWMHVTGFSLFALAGVCLVLHAVGRQGADSSVGPPWLSRIGFYSYSIYLWHLPWVRVVDAALVGRWSVNRWVFAYLPGSLVIGVVLGRWIEWPALRLRDRWFPREPSMVHG